MRGKIVKVWPRNERGPGSVVFDTADGPVKFSTFDEDVLAAARRLDGRVVVYDTVQKGRYTNLASVAVADVSAAAPEIRVRETPAETPVWANRLADAMNRLAMAVADFAEAARAQTTAVPAVPLAKMPAPALIEASHAEKLAARVGADAAAAMLSALAKKHTTPDAYTAAVVALLARHGEDEVPF